MPQSISVSITETCTISAIVTDSSDFESSFKRGLLGACFHSLCRHTAKRLCVDCSSRQNAHSWTLLLHLFYNRLQDRGTQDDRGQIAEQRVSRQGRSDHRIEQESYQRWRADYTTEGQNNKVHFLEVKSQGCHDSGCWLTGSKDKGDDNVADLVLCTSGISSIF